MPKECQKAGNRPSEVLLREMIEGIENRRTKNSLETLWNALIAMQREKAPDFSISRVGKYSEKLGGPKTQSIRNRNGQKFRELIHSFAAEIGEPVTKSKRRPSDNIDRALEEIRDPGAQKAIKMLLERGRRLEKENDELRSAFKTLSVSTVNIALPSPPDQNSGTVPCPSSLKPLSIYSIEKFLSVTWMDARFWRMELDGSIVDEVTEGQIIAPPGFVDALQEILSHR